MATKSVLTNKKMYEVIQEVAGQDAVSVVEFLKDRKNISEFLIAEKTKLDMQTTRNVLYKLNSHNVAQYVRRKDRKKGWYISYWTFNRKRVKDVILKLTNEKLERLTERLKREEENRDSFFICKNACVRLEFDSAVNFEYKCPECAQMLSQQENAKTIDNIKAKIKELQTAS